MWKYLQRHSLKAIITICTIPSYIALANTKQTMVLIECSISNEVIDQVTADFLQNGGVATLPRTSPTAHPNTFRCLSSHCHSSNQRCCISICCCICICIYSSDWTKFQCIFCNGIPFGIRQGGQGQGQGQRKEEANITKWKFKECSGRHHTYTYDHSYNVEELAGGEE